MRDPWDEGVLNLDCGGGSYKPTHVKNCIDTHTQMSACKTGEVLVRWMDCINVNQYPVVILYYSYSRSYH